MEFKKKKKDWTVCSTSLVWFVIDWFQNDLKTPNAEHDAILLCSINILILITVVSLLLCGMLDNF